jgi:hypothetical protein
MAGKPRDLTMVPFEDDDISDDDFDPGERHRKQSDLVREIASGSLGLDFEKQEDMAEFRKKYESCLTGEGTLIHLVLDSCHDDNFDPFKPLLKFMISKYPILLETSNQLGETTLHYAIQKRLGRVTEFLCRNAPQQAAARAISCRGQLQGNCLHAAIRLRLDVDVICYLISICEADTLNDQSHDGSIPLHLAVGLTRPRKIRETAGDRMKRLAKPLQDVDNQISTISVAENPQQASRRRQFSAEDDSTGQTLAANTRANDQGSHVIPPQLVLQAGAPSSHYSSLQSLLPVVEALVRRDPSGLSRRNAITLLTPYQERLRQLQKAKISKYFQEKHISDSKTDHDTEKERELAFRALVIGDPIAAFIREYCVRSFSRDQAMASLYQPGQGESYPPYLSLLRLGLTRLGRATDRV